MSETHDPHADASGATGTSTEDPGPQLNRNQVRDLDQLRRSTSDRYVAGVAGGLGRHFGIDPTILRVLFAVGCLFGGAGLLFYAAVWLFVPEDGRAQAPVHVSGETRRLLLIIAGVVALLALVGDGWGGYGWHWAVWPLGVVAIVVAVIAGSRRRTGMPGPIPGAPPATSGPAGTAPAAAATTPTATTPAGTAPPAPTAPTTPGSPGSTYGPPYGPPPPSGPVAPYAPAPPNRPRRTGLVLFWPTLALLALGWGVLGIYDIDHHVAAGAYAALPLAIVGVMLVLGSFVGRPGGLILLGALLVPVLSVTTVIDSVHWEARTQRYVPVTASQVQDSYQIGNGRMVVDLSRVADPTALAGRTIDLTGKAGEIKVILPPGVRTDVDASLEFAGSVEAGDLRDESGFSPELSTTLFPPGATREGAALHLDVHARVGHIEIDTERD
jgi:phage shock protein PspC (stress-responsive transcriptional regulator)